MNQAMNEKYAGQKGESFLHGVKPEVPFFSVGSVAYNLQIGNIYVVYKWEKYCQLGEYISPIPPMKGTIETAISPRNRGENEKYGWSFPT